MSWMWRTPLRTSKAVRYPSKMFFTPSVHSHTRWAGEDSLMTVQLSTVMGVKLHVRTAWLKPLLVYSALKRSDMLGTSDCEMKPKQLILKMPAWEPHSPSVWQGEEWQDNAILRRSYCVRAPASRHFAWVALISFCNSHISSPSMSLCRRALSANLNPPILCSPPPSSHSEDCSLCGNITRGQQLAAVNLLSPPGFAHISTGQVCSGS